MTTAVLLRSGMRRKAHVPFCRAVEGATLSLTLIKNQKQESNMGKKNNQKFVQVPTGKLKDRIEQLCNEYGIQLIETEESYSSKASSLDLDDIPVFGAKPDEWKPLGKRVKRGLYRSATGIELNADINGAINIARKVAKQYEFNFDPRSFVRGVLTMPMRVKLWDRACPYLNKC